VRSLPPPPFLGPIAARSALIWLFLHGASLVGAGGEDVPFLESVVGTPTVSVVICAVVLVLMRIELWRRSELVFLANLGCSFARVAMLIVVECALLETALRLTVV
jgi:hypothetical protein